MDRRQQLLKEISGAPVTEILGIVSERSAALLGQPDGSYSLLLTLHGWKEVGGHLERTELDLRQHAPDSELRRVFGVVKPYDTVRLLARVLKENVFGTPQGQLIQLRQIGAADSELAAFAAELQKPVTLEHALFGVFELDRSVDWFKATTTWLGDQIEVTVSADAVDKCLESARELWSAQAAWQTRIEDFAISDLLKLKNETWSEEGEADVTPDEFREHMRLESIAIPRPREFEFWFADGDMFWGHLIRVSGTIDGGPKFVGLEG